MLAFLKNFSSGRLNIFAAKDGYVALDIGSSSVKMIEAAVDRNGYRILSLGILPLPDYAIQNNMVVDSKPVVESIRKLISDNRVKSTQVISAVPGRAVIMKKVQMPKQESQQNWKPISNSKRRTSFRKTSRTSIWIIKCCRKSMAATKW